MDDIPSRPNPVVVPGSTSYPDVFRHRDLYVVDVLVVPDRLKEGVSEPEGKDVLDGFFPEVMVDPEDLLRFENLGQHFFKLPSRLQVVAEGFLNDDSAPSIRGRGGKTRLCQLCTNLREGVGWDRQVEGVVSAGSPGFVQFLNRESQALERLRVVEVSFHKPQASDQLFPG